MDKNIGALCTSPYYLDVGFETTHVIISAYLAVTFNIFRLPALSQIGPGVMFKIRLKFRAER